MIRVLKNNFMQAAFGSMVWVMLLTSLSNKGVQVDYYYIWNMIGIGALFGLVFGVIYPFLWEYSNLHSFLKVIISSIVNFFCSIIAVWLYSINWFMIMKPYMIAMFVITLVLHFILFYIYQKYENNKLVKKLNK